VQQIYDRGYGITSPLQSRWAQLTPPYSRSKIWAHRFLQTPSWLTRHNVIIDLIKRPEFPQPLTPKALAKAYFIWRHCNCPDCSYTLVYAYHSCLISSFVGIPSSRSCPTSAVAKRNDDERVENSPQSSYVLDCIGDLMQTQYVFHIRFGPSTVSVEYQWPRSGSLHSIVSGQILFITSSHRSSLFHSLVVIGLYIYIYIYIYNTAIRMCYWVKYRHLLFY